MRMITDNISHESADFDNETKTWKKKSNCTLHTRQWSHYLKDKLFMKKFLVKKTYS